MKKKKVLLLKALFNKTITIEQFQKYINYPMPGFVITYGGEFDNQEDRELIEIANKIGFFDMVIMDCKVPKNE